MTPDSKRHPVWYPYTQMAGTPDPIKIVSGKGALLFPENGEPIIDAIASWWVNAHGHAHPYIASKLFEQAQKLEQVIFSGFTHEPAEALARRLIQCTPSSLQHVFYSDNGSTAVEVALKMAWQYSLNSGKPRKKILALENSYHGDTVGAMSVSARSAFTRPFQDWLFDVHFLPAPYPGQEKSALAELDRFLNVHGNDLAAFIYEPLVQGASGMLMYSAESLNDILQMVKAFGALCIADEVMTGFWRTGSLLASEQCTFLPDIVCLSKALTGGFMPLGVTMASSEIYDAFLGEWQSKTLFHGHSFTGNPLSCTAALASLDLFEQPDFKPQYQAVIHQQREFATSIENHPALQDIRIQGTIVALERKGESGYFAGNRNSAYQFFIENNVLLRPLGNVWYILPPYCITAQELAQVYDVILRGLAHE